MPETASLANLLSDEWNQGMSFDAFLDYSKKNVDKMKENYEKTEISPALSADVNGFAKEARILVIGADWCGDVVANVPSVAKLVELNRRLQLRIVDRDRHDALMLHFLTNGSKSIPVIIVCPPHMRTFASWGPRPAMCQAIMTNNKGKMPKEEIYPMLRDWYKNDRFQTVMAEIWEMIKAQGQAVENIPGLRV